MAAGTLVSSGSSLNMPTGSGSERLCRASIHALNGDTQEILSGTAGHIYTIISIIVCNQTATSGGAGIFLSDGTSDINIMRYAGNPVGGNQTFVWNDRFVIEENDDLDVYNEFTNGDWWVSYIDQNWV